MAIHPEVSNVRVELPPPAISIERVEAWTISQAADVLAATSLSPHAARGTGMSVTIDIPLDEQVLCEEAPRPRPEAVHTVYKRREPIRRDSQKRREALQKGKEGSRRRQRWENDRLLSNPHAAPPLPSDWQVQPTHPVHSVPYFLAPLWDAEYARKQQERQKRVQASKQHASKEEAAAAKVTQELRAKLKKSRGAKGLLQDLEEEVRGFVQQWEQKQKELESEGLIEPDSSDEEIVFVGRNGAMSDKRKREKQHKHLEKDKLVFQGLVDDHGAAFGRYLVHSIAAYYGLKTYSITTGNPARREAYVGLKIDPKTRRPSLTRAEMPRPLWTVSGVFAVVFAMCQLCGIKNGLARWPKAVEAMKPALELLIENAHEEHEAWKKAGASTPSESLLEVCRLLLTMIESIEEERENWWTSPEKRAQRQRFELEDPKKFTELHKINNALTSDVEAMRTRLGSYARWTLDMRGGLADLE
ncbi:hypothetical protein AC579_2673 [Pseudocercospora musae]|uniref:R3H-associated N-terminal domain-containing protein n=1 Tax=Pseudocercospora musae TaxID=113226 RepID=A0A139IVF1_9PEZI|nr:hypothetical protein AC579_2673 [Pseudocercospora musae]